MINEKEMEILVKYSIWLMNMGYIEEGFDLDFIAESYLMKEANHNGTI